MNLWNETKSVPISRPMVWEAYKKVRSNQGSAGVDQISRDEFEANRSKYLYKLWNRMASGSYFPPPVKEVEIPKKDGKVRKLGIPTIGDRVAQMVVKEYIEPRFEKIFSSNSYGYRPNRNAHQALESVRENCRKTDWVIDLDIKGFFDNIDHDKLLLAIEKHVSEKWCVLYIKRWLQMPVQTKSGELVQKLGKGTPQGGVISPLLANLFLHYAMDMWLENTHPTVSYVRYADDAILHCRNKAQAEEVLKTLNERMQSCRLELHPEKTDYSSRYEKYLFTEGIVFGYLKRFDESQNDFKKLVKLDPKNDLYKDWFKSNQTNIIAKKSNIVGYIGCGIIFLEIISDIVFKIKLSIYVDLIGLVTMILGFTFPYILRLIGKIK